MKGYQFRNLAGKVAAAVEEMNYAQRRMATLRFSLDPYMMEPDKGPDTYDEFLARTSGPLLHEPAASRRSQRGNLR